MITTRDHPPLVALTDEIRDRFGILPNFFLPPPGLGPDGAEVVAGLWAHAKAWYVDLPLPPRLKERLFIHLSRFCEVRYCIVRHSCYLVGEGRPSGDARATPDSVDGLSRLVRRPLPDPTDLRATLDRLRSRPAIELPPAGSPFEQDLFDALAAVFNEPRHGRQVRAAIIAAVGERATDLLTVLIAFVKTAHRWTELHPDLPFEPDAEAFLRRNPRLAQLLLDPADARAPRQAAGERAITTPTDPEARLVESMDTGFNVVEIFEADDGHMTGFRVAESNPGQQRALVRHPQIELVAGSGPSCALGELRLDLVDQTAFVGDRMLDLTRTEFRLLAMLAAHPGRLLTRDELASRLGLPNSGANRRGCDAHVKNLRRKIEDDPAHPTHILTVRGVGYLLRAT